MSESKRQCEVCHVEFSARRATARFCGGTCRQQANRAKAKNAPRKGESLFSSILEQQNKLRAIVLEAGAEYFPAWKKTPTVRMELMAYKIASEFERMLDQTKRSIQATMQAKIDKERENYNRQWEYNQKLFADYVAILAKHNEAAEGLSAEDWETLRDMDDAELKRWVTVGGRMAKNSTVDNAAEQAMRWVVENRPAAYLPGSNGNGNNKSLVERGEP